ncbi:MAG: hypothetical protein AB7G93_17045 [Bdellovibrionales bacterium]
MLHWSRFLFLSSLLIAGTSAHASRARLLALGQDANGSLFIEDSRNVFLNPAWITLLPDQLNLEAGPTNSDTGTNPNRVTNSPKAEGGLAYQWDKWGLGVQLGRVSKENKAIIEQTSTADNFLDPQNSIEIIAGTGGDQRWGGSIHYAYALDDRTSANNGKDEGRTLVLRGGMQNETLQVYGTFAVFHESENIDSTGLKKEYDGDLTTEWGASYKLSEDGRVGGSVRLYGYSFDDGAAARGDSEGRTVSATYFHYLRKQERNFVFGSAGIYWDDQKSDFEVDGATDKKQKYLALPVSLGLERILRDWLILRGSVTQNVLIHKDEFKDGTNDSKKENFDSTTVTLGTGLTFESLVLDATLEGSTTGKLNASTLMANLGLTYIF